MLLICITAFLEPSWTVSLRRAEGKSLMFNWTNLTAAIKQHMVGYFVLVRNTNGTVVNVVFATGNASYANIPGLTPYTEYHVRVIGISSDGNPYNSSNITAWTDETGMLLYFYCQSCIKRSPSVHGSLIQGGRLIYTKTRRKPFYFAFITT